MNSVPTASFHQLAAAVKSLVAEPFALQIGAMDGVKFDLLNPHLTKGGWSGLLVEPIADMFEILKATYKDQPQLKLENCAVSDCNGTLTLKRVAPKRWRKAVYLPKPLASQPA